ncbi:MAG: arsenosugar biosynthesis radical SAM protein ArsS [Proteobacteria bacterium]|nr:arsenosugar biosynthesis radical SAM protein ArsS [Pseudomonadota bacterium]
MQDARPRLLEIDFPALRRERVSTLQVNLGYRCNLRCVHCHVNAGPSRTEMMSPATADEVIEVLDRLPLRTLDLTGGAPELNPEFRRLVAEARKRGLEVIDRCNLTVLFEPGQETLADFLAGQGVTIVASLPCYLEENVEQQRGKGVYDDSLRALRRLNRLGYGTDPGLQLHLAFNPVGPVLPPPQAQLEADYKRELGDRYGIVFNQLFVIANMPINRFGAVLMSQGRLDSYVELLRANYSQDNLSTVMCRDSISVDWQGYLYDCDFNQMLHLPALREGRRAHLRDLKRDRSWDTSPIATAGHCYGCTAGQGSSCGGALT